MNLTIWKIKKTGKVVVPIGNAGTGYTLCLFPHKDKTRRGNLGVTQIVKDSNLVKEGSVDRE